MLDRIFQFDCKEEKVKKLDLERMYVTQHKMIFFDEKIYLYGGFYPYVTHKRALFCLDLKEGQWTILPTGSSFSPNHCRAHCLEIYKNQILLFGGFEDQEVIAPNLYSIMIGILK